MKKEYMEALLAQIREKHAREYVRQEMEGHIEEQEACYMAKGLPQNEAEEKAVADMGDPVEAGTALDLIHRPRPAWGMLAMIALLCAVGIFLQYVVQLWEPDQMGSAYFQKHCQYAALGFLILCGAYLMDYTRIAKYSKWICAGILLFLCIRASGGGLIQWILLDSSFYLYLYPPLYGAVLYSYRNGKKRDLWIVLLYTIAPVFLSLRMVHLSVAMNLTAILLLMLCVTAAKGWYSMKRISLLKAICLLLAGLSAFGACYLRFLPAYQTARIQGWLNAADFADGAGYISNAIRSILGASQLVGSNAKQPIGDYLPNYATDYMLTYTIGKFGILAGAALAILILMLGAKLLYLSIHQKNQLGMAMGIGCSLVFGIQSVEYILVNLSLLPPSGLYFPFVSFGGSSMLCTYILLGILLSIYRYQDIVPEPKVGYAGNVKKC